MVDLRRRAPTSTPRDKARQRFARRQWARRWLALRHVLVGLAVVALVATGIWVVWFSQVLAVKAVDVHGTRLLTTDQVRRVAAVPEDVPLARVDLVGTLARVEALAEVSSADVSRSWPDTVRIQVVERVSVAVVDLGGRMRGMDQEGVVFQEFKSVPADLPRVQTSGTPSPEALREAAGVVGALPAGLASRVEHVEVASVDQISLVLRDGRQVVWGSAEDGDLKARVLEALLEQKARVYDVSVPTSPVTRATP